MNTGALDSTLPDDEDVRTAHQSIGSLAIYVVKVGALLSAGYVAGYLMGRKKRRGE